MRFGTAVLFSRPIGQMQRLVRGTLIGAHRDRVCVRLDQQDCRRFTPHQRGRIVWMARSKVEATWKRTPYDNTVAPRKVNQSDEREFAAELTEMGLHHVYEPFEIPYRLHGVDRIFVPDFYIPSENLVIELKSTNWAFWKGGVETRAKLRAARKAGFDVALMVNGRVQYWNGNYFV